MRNLEIKTLQVGQLQTNCYLVINKKTREVFILDPGDDAELIISYILREELIPKYIVATHGHFDHILAVLELQLAFNIPFLIHKKDMFLLKRMQETTKYFCNFNPGPSPKPNIYIKNNDVLKIRNILFNIINIPGHTPGSIALHCIKENVLFVGDLIFENKGIGRTDFKYSDSLKLNKSIDKIKKLPGETVVYPGHGSEFTISDYREGLPSTS